MVILHFVCIPVGEVHVGFLLDFYPSTPHSIREGGVKAESRRTDDVTAKCPSVVSVDDVGPRGSVTIQYLESCGTDWT